MNNISGKPYLLKQVNLSVVRKAIKDMGSATRAEIVKATQISVTTVRTLLTEMLENNELLEVGYDESIGGRKAVRYALRKDRFFGAAFCISDDGIRYIIVDICGEICESGMLTSEEGDLEAICGFLDGISDSREIKSIGIGVPGVVDGMCYQRKNPTGEIRTHSIGEIVRNRYGVPVILENDMKAVALGFGRCYLKEYPEESYDRVNIAYIYLDKRCISAGFLSEGRVLRGWSNFVGELGLFPIDETRTLDDLIFSPMDDVQYASIVAKVVAAICCILNPQYIAIGGIGFRKNCLPLVSECLIGAIPDKMCAELLYAEDIWHDYLDGMAYLTAGQIFANVLLINE